MTLFKVGCVLSVWVKVVEVCCVLLAVGANWLRRESGAALLLLVVELFPADS